MSDTPRTDKALDESENVTRSIPLVRLCKILELENAELLKDKQRLDKLLEEGRVVSISTTTFASMRMNSREDIDKAYFPSNTEVSRGVRHERS